MSVDHVSGRSDQQGASKPITLKTMGSLFFGGTVTRAEDGEPFHGDHGCAQYYIPQNSRNYPLVMWHGIGQSGKTFESTPDGREGFMSILPRRDWAVYIIDQPRRGRAGRTQTVETGRFAVPHGREGKCRLGRIPARCLDAAEARHSLPEPSIPPRSGDDGPILPPADTRYWCASSHSGASDFHGQDRRGIVPPDRSRRADLE